LAANGTLARFQKTEFASGEVASPRSPIPPDLASGEIRRNGTAVVTTLIGSGCVVWAFTALIPAIRKTTISSCKVFLFIFDFLSVNNSFTRI
jgi:hypothetical protein